MCIITHIFIYIYTRLCVCVRPAKICQLWLCLFRTIHFLDARSQTSVQVRHEESLSSQSVPVSSFRASVIKKPPLNSLPKNPGHGSDSRWLQISTDIYRYLQISTAASSIVIHDLHVKKEVFSVKGSP